MNVPIILVGSKNNKLFFKIIKNLVVKEKHQVLLKITAKTFPELLKQIEKKNSEIIDFKINASTQVRNGFIRSETSKEIKRCEPLKRQEIIKVKEIISFYFEEKQEKKVITKNYEVIEKILS